MLDDFSIVPYEGGIYRIIDILKPIKDFYPNYSEWLEKTVSSGIMDETRQIRILLNDSKIAGLNILKNTPDEKKICSLFIHPDYRGEAWIYAIFNDSLEFLKTSKPTITIPEPIVKKYHGLIFSNKWENTSKIENRYIDGVTEYGFNEKEL